MMSSERGSCLLSKLRPKRSFTHELVGAGDGLPFRGVNLDQSSTVHSVRSEFLTSFDSMPDGSEVTLV